MKLATILESVAYKKFVTVDLPGGSHQHELNGVGALKDFFKTTEKKQGDITWVYFSDNTPPVTEEGSFTFYDARAKSAALTGRSEWRLFYRGSFFLRAKVGDLFVLMQTRRDKLFGCILPSGSRSFEGALDLLRIDRNLLKFDCIPYEALRTSEIPIEEDSYFFQWLKYLSPDLQQTPAISDSLKTQNLPFKPRARMLVLLGDQLIRDAGIAVFELVKNAYDADATKVHVTLSNVTDKEKGKVVIEDNGSGMNWNQIVTVWLEPGTDFRQLQKTKGYRTPLFHRMPLGEKGVGRFAAHKLGKLITLISKQKHFPEVVVEINWNDFSTERYLEDAKVNVFERNPLCFTEDATGTRIEISDLNEGLSRGVIRTISRSVNSISSPFRSPSEFGATLEVLPHDNTLAGILDINSVLEIAPYKAACIISDDLLSYDYEFIPPTNMQKIAGRKVENKILSVPTNDLFGRGELQRQVGPIYIEFRIYDLDSQILAYTVSDKKGFKEFLRTNGGIRVYRDGMRVYDYGEPGNDWLNLGGSRVNNPTARVSNNQIIGAVHLGGSMSAALVEKTNREGFIEDENYLLFRNAVDAALTQIVFERNVDKNRLRQIYSTKKQKQPVLSELTELRLAIEQHPSISQELLPYVDSVESKYIEMRDTLMTAAGAGLTLSIVIHEVEKAIHGLSIAVEREVPVAQLRDLAVHLNELIEGLTFLTRKSGRQNETFGNLISQAIRNTNYRTKAHEIKIYNGIESGDIDMTVRCTRRLIIATLMNLIDNSIYWLSTKRATDRRILLGTSNDISGGPVLFVADNGPGFQDDPDILIQPFMTRKPEGMGLGLHVASSIMQTHDDGKLIFPTTGDLGISDDFSGAIVGLQFKA